MKKLYTLLIALLAINSVMAQGCLPEGITFTTQEQIDNFQTNYPGCTEIEGNVIIRGDNITNLQGLKKLNTIGGSLRFGIYAGSGNPRLKNIAGLDSLIALGGDLAFYNNDSLVNFFGLESLKIFSGNIWIHFNNSLKNLDGLSNVTTIGYYLSIANNSSLTNLSGLENLISINGDLQIAANPALIDLSSLINLSLLTGTILIYDNLNLESLQGLNTINKDSVDYIQIKNNSKLNECEVEFLCNYLYTGNISFEIKDNSIGCNNKLEIEEKCAIGFYEILKNNLIIFPNPSSSRFTIQFSLEKEEQVKLLVLNNLGQVVATLANETLSEGQHELNWNAEEMPAGVYFYNIQIGNQAGTGKMVLMK